MLSFPNSLIALDEVCVVWDDENRSILPASISFESNVCHFCAVEFLDNEINHIVNDWNARCTLLTTKKAQLKNVKRNFGDSVLGELRTIISAEWKKGPDKKSFKISMDLLLHNLYWKRELMNGRRNIVKNITNTALFLFIATGKPNAPS